jgi:uncharacterized repeat protein (TIGR01451 family)
VRIGAATTRRALPPGAYQDLRVTWDSPPVGLQQIYVVANDPGVGAALPECTLLNNTHHLPLLIGSDVYITKQVSAPDVAAGETLTYTLTIYNDGPLAATEVVITDSLPAATTFASTTQGGIYRQDTGAVTWPPVTLAAGNTISYDLTVRVDAGLPAGLAAITNTATLAASGDTNPDNNRAVTVTPLRVPTGPDLIIPFMDGRDTETDFSKLTLTGAVLFGIANQDQEPAVGPFMVTLFEDRDLDAVYTPAADAVLGVYSQELAVAAGETVSVTVPVSGTVLFRGNLIYGFIDSGNDVGETDEGNNYNNTSVGCNIDVNGIRQLAADISVSRLQVDRSKLPASATITVRIGNGGAVTVPAGLAVSFYPHDPRQPGNPIGTTLTTRDLAPGEYEDLRWVWERPRGVGAVYVNADDPGTREGAIQECNEVNNDPAVAFSKPNDW